jgi:oxygen-dependent protoporphyrinogen oxidase
MTKPNVDITIIGAGLTGLTLAWYLKRAGKKVLLLDRNNRAGGVIETVHDQGFIFEKGPNTGVIGTTEIVELFNDLKVSIQVEVPDAASKNRWVWKQGKWHALPSGHKGITTPLFSLKDKLRMLGEPFRKPGNNADETLADMVERRLGHTFLDYAVDPFVSGIYAGDPRKLVTRYALPKLYNLEQKYGSFIKGAYKKHKEPKTELEKKVSREVFSVKGGLSNLVEALSQGIGDENLLLNIRGLKINPTENGFSCVFQKLDQEITVESEKVITTCDGKSLPAILGFIPSELLNAVSNAEYAKVIQVVAGYNQWEGIKLNAFGGLVPSVEKRDILGVLFPSALFENRAPKNGALLSIFLGGINKPEFFYKDDQEIESLVLANISEMLKCEAKPDLLKIFRYEKAIPQYEQSTGVRLQAVEYIQTGYPGLILAGNLRDGIGMADRVKQARQVANQIIQQS